MQRIEGIIYINLARRTDRRQQLESELQRLGVPSEKVRRFEAIEEAAPGVACCRSHAAALQLAYDSGLQNVLILEDDFEFLPDAQRVQAALGRLFEEVPDWQVVMLTHNDAEGKAHNDFLHRTHKAGNAAAYLVRRSAMLPLRDTIAGVVDIYRQTGAHWLYQNDVIWCKLMPQLAWYHFQPKLGRQRPGYSDLSRAYADYGSF